MATNYYTKREAMGRAIELARDNADAYGVYKRRTAYMVRNAATPPAFPWSHIGTASYSDGSTVVFRFND